LDYLGTGALTLSSERLRTHKPTIYNSVVQPFGCLFMCVNTKEGQPNFVRQIVRYKNCVSLW